MAPQIQPGSDEANRLQNAVQGELAQRGWSTEDDTVMAEYCTVMLSNHKTPDQISTELSDLIGPDFQSSFTDWLFKQVDIYYPDPNQPAPSAPAPGAEPEPSTSQQEPQADGRRGGADLFGSAVSGMKRDRRDDSSGPQQPPAQRQRFDGPRERFDRNGDRGGDRGDRNRRDGERGGRGRGDGRLIDRMGGPPPRGDRRNDRQGGPRNGPPMQPGMMGPNGQMMINPQMFAQAQANIMAQAQMLQAMWQQQQGGQPHGRGRSGPPPNMFPGGGPGFNPNAPSFVPGQGRPGFGPPPHMAQQPPRPLPSKPTNDALCKYGVDCHNPWCDMSHPSPVATKESGLVLSSEPCEKQIKCEDPDCSKSHVSPEQKKVSQPPPQAGAPNGAPAGGPEQQQQQQQGPPAIPGAGERPCKFGAHCTRPGCVFLHPWQMRGQPGQSIPCRFGVNCMRPDCKFMHPEGRQLGKPFSNRSTVFNTGSASPAPAAAEGASNGAEKPAEEGETKPANEAGDMVA